MTLLLMPPYLIFAFFIMRAVLKKQLTRKRKWQMGLLTAFLLYLPMGWDVILGRAVFYSLCATQGGVHVYKTVELGSEYFDKDGVSLFYDRDQYFTDMSLRGYFVGIKDIEISDDNFLNISRTEYKIVDNRNNNVLGTYVKYANFGGWFMNYTGFAVKGVSCPIKENLDNDLIRLTTSVFIKDN